MPRDVRGMRELLELIEWARSMLEKELRSDGLDKHARATVRSVVAALTPEHNPKLTAAAVAMKKPEDA